MNFGENLKELRKERNLSQEGLAEILNVSRQAISKWESNLSYPDMDNLVAISELFGVTLDSLIKGQESVQQAHISSSPFGGWIRCPSYEYKSRRSLLGLPLVHVNFGRGQKRARGIIAVGNIATGVVAVGFLSFGVLSFGLLSLGLISLGCLAVGLLGAVGAIAVGAFAVGAVAVGIFSLGAVAGGMFTMGAVSWASQIAVGYHATGHIAIGAFPAGVQTIVDTSVNHDFSQISQESVRTLILQEFPDLWDWIVRLMTSFFP